MYSFPPFATTSSSSSTLFFTPGASLLDKQQSFYHTVDSAAESHNTSIFEQMASVPWSVTWRKGLVSLPRLVPDLALRFTSPEGPQPLVIRIPSRGSHLIPLYVFIPRNPAPAAAENDGSPTPQLPVLVDFHGGGFVLGSPQEQAPFCSKVCRELNCVAISVDYRLGPYAQFPAAVEDAEDVVKALLDSTTPQYTRLRRDINEYLISTSRPKITLDTSRIAFSGFSSGGNLALNLVLDIQPPHLSEAWPSPVPQLHAKEIPVLMYFPSVDLRQLPSERPKLPILDDAPKGLVDSLALEESLVPTYMPRDKTSHPRASPGLAKIKDGGLHPQAKILLILAEKDSLTKQCEDWVERMIEEGREADLTIEKYMGVLHGWTQYPDSWLDEHSKLTKIDAQVKGVDFLRKWWKKT